MLVTTDLRCEYAVNPLGIDVSHPRLSWKLRDTERGQVPTAYRIEAATSLASLASGAADLWDSGKVASDAISADYGGRALRSGERCYWQVRAWDAQGQLGPVSPPAWFEVGLLTPEDWQAEWIGFPAGFNGRAIYFRKAFTLQKSVVKARGYVVGLGYYELRLNGQKVGDHVLDPGQTDYSRSVLYATYDLGPYLQEGRNVVGVIVGNGWYGAPKLLLQLTFKLADGTTHFVCTNRSPSTLDGDGGPWRVSVGPIVENSVFGGETYDARLEKPGWDTADFVLAPAEWPGAMAVEGPGGRLVAQAAEPMRVTRTLAPIARTQPSPGVFVFDFGQNLAGWAALRARGERGSRVTLRFAESLYGDGSVNQENLRSAAATDTYIFKGDGVETREPRFTYHGFRYVQVEGYPGEPEIDAIAARVVRSAVESSGHFSCSNDLLNRIHQMIWWTEHNNQHSIPTDCPQRDERMGWLNDMAARSEQTVHNFDVSRFLAKWIADIEDAQNPQTGAITDTAPYRWGRRPADPVSVCYLLIPWLLYTHYGDTHVLAEHYAGMKGWVDFLTSQAAGHIVRYGYYGDWSPPVGEGIGGSLGDSAVSRNTPGPLVSTGFYYYAARLLAQIASVLGVAADAQAYDGLASRIAEVYNATFWDEATGRYGFNNQACNALSLYMGLVPEDRQGRVLASLVRDVVELHDGHLTTGNLCTKYLLEALSAAGRSDVAYRVATQETYPSWGYMLANGATTLWERWEHKTGGGMNSHDHPMMGSVGAWFYRWLAGIQADPAGPAFARFDIRPQIVGDLAWVRASLDTVRGPIEVAWERTATGLRLDVTVPVGSQARVHVPAFAGGAIRERGLSVWQDGAPGDRTNGMVAVRQAESVIVFTVGSGRYAFLSAPA